MLRDHFSEMAKEYRQESEAFNQDWGVRQRLGTAALALALAWKLLAGDIGHRDPSVQNRMKEERAATVATYTSGLEEILPPHYAKTVASVSVAVRDVLPGDVVIKLIDHALTPRP